MRQICTLLATAAMPAAIVSGRVHASTDPAAMIAQISANVRAMKDDYASQLKALEDGHNDLATRIAAGQLHGGLNRAPADPEYTATFASYMRGGDSDGEASLRTANANGTARGAINAAMQTGDNSQGGYLAPVEWDRQVRKAQRSKSPMRRLCDVKVTRVGGYSTVWNNGEWGSGWVGETASRPATTTPTLASITYKHGALYANPGISQDQLDDADFDMENWISDELADTFDKQESVAFISGNGVNKPMGLLQYAPGGAADTDQYRHPAGNLAVVASGHATTIPGPDVLVDFVYSLPAAYRTGASWLMNSTTRATLAKMKDGDGRFIYTESLIAGQPATLLGYPVEIDENMPSIAAGALAVAFGNFQAAYVINDRGQIRVVRDNVTNKPFVHFYTWKRVGGGVKDPYAVRLLKIAAS